MNMPGFTAEAVFSTNQSGQEGTVVASSCFDCFDGCQQVYRDHMEGYRQCKMSCSASPNPKACGECERIMRNARIWLSQCIFDCSHSCGMA